MSRRTTRVIYGWGINQDFDDTDDAFACAAEIAAMPTRDPALTHVSVVDITRRDEFGAYPVLFHAEREVSS